MNKVAIGRVVLTEEACGPDRVFSRWGTRIADVPPTLLARADEVPHSTPVDFASVPPEELVASLSQTIEGTSGWTIDTYIEPAFDDTRCDDWLV
jgi:hypothetical protein